ncbi:hypothetical protein AKJ51_05065 [candidate division MSBL1 archaeon SCGC-AAA382A20]|uniref:FAD/NAD(P)-binding domain-containing protein n=1 Tax=candidate division MSBL1 archaeon SCGC-AAA382A20 TaxID=1698280 RepID=A0A133VG48_9EURY|nr:hypothetical protein AKJ51_05065 [candidate division MSBL1 archaeon SCGC-AAA382A20]
MKLVILGGGFCGAKVAKDLDNYQAIDVTIIDEKTFFEYKPGVLKVISDSGYSDEVLVPYKNFLKKSQILTGKVTKVTPNFVEFEDEKIDYDALLISTGVDYPVFLENKDNVYTPTTVSSSLEINKKLSNADTVLIIGGGLIGTEVAAEIVTKQPEKELKIIHSAERLIERNPKKASDYARDFLEKRGAEIIFDERVTKNEDGNFKTDSKSVVEADLGIWCAGIDWNPYFMEGFESSVFTEKGSILVDKYLRLESYSDVFVGGDITQIDEEKTAQNAKKHAEIITENLKRGRKGKKLLPYRSAERPLVISLGDTNGILVNKSRIFTGIIPGFLKWAVEYWTLSHYDGLLGKLGL